MIEYIAIGTALLLSAGAWAWVIKNYANKGAEAYIMDSYANIPKFAIISLAAIPIGILMLPILVVRKCLKQLGWM
jgi:hypothetical protein